MATKKTAKKKAAKRAAPKKKKAAAKRRPMAKEQREAVALVRRARKGGWTLEDMAAHLGCSFASVSRWDNGVAVPYRNQAVRMIPMLKELCA